MLFYLDVVDGKLVYKEHSLTKVSDTKVGRAFALRAEEEMLSDEYTRTILVSY